MNSGNKTLIAELSWAWRIRIIIRSKDEHQIANLTAAQHVWWIMKFGTAFEKQALNHVYREWFQANATLQRLGPDPSVTLPSPLMTSTTTPIRRQGFDLFIELFFSELTFGYSNFNSLSLRILCFNGRWHLGKFQGLDEELDFWRCVYGGSHDYGRVSDVQTITSTA